MIKFESNINIGYIFINDKSLYNFHFQDVNFSNVKNVIK